MNHFDHQLLKEVYDLNYKQIKQVFSLMRKMGIGIDQAAKRVKSNAK